MSLKKLSPFSFSMLGWALNEEASIGEYIEKAEVFLQSVTTDYELIIIDDGSTDRTFAIAQDYQKTRPWLRIYQNEGNFGSGYNLKRSLALAKKDYVFWQTVDWAYDITELGCQIHLLEKYDVLQGVRVNQQKLLTGRSDNQYKAIISIVNYYLVYLLFRLPLSDYQNVTIYPHKLIQSITIESQSAFTNPECLLKTWWKGASIKEIPVPFIKRGKGTAKGTRWRFIRATIGDILYWWWRWVVLQQRDYLCKGKISRWNSHEQ